MAEDYVDLILSDTDSLAATVKSMPRGGSRRGGLGGHSDFEYLLSQFF